MLVIVNSTQPGVTWEKGTSEKYPDQNSLWWSLLSHLDE